MLFIVHSHDGARLVVGLLGVALEIFELILGQVSLSRKLVVSLF